MMPAEHPPGHKNLMNKTTYEVKVACSNCGYKSKVTIDKGRTALTVVRKKECENCGCLTLHQVK